jgi:hypothetical protein
MASPSMMVDELIGKLRSEVLEIWDSNRNNEKRSEEIFKLCQKHKIGELMLPESTQGELLNRIERKRNQELEEMRNRQVKDIIDMRFSEHPQFKGLDMKNASETNRQIEILKIKKLIEGRNCNITNIENKIPVKKNLYENFGLEIPMDVINWERQANIISQDEKKKRLRKKKGQARMTKR